MNGIQERLGSPNKIYFNLLHINKTIPMSRYKEKDSRTPNWIELPVHPPEARSVQIHNLNQGTTYEFQVNVYHTLSLGP